MHELAVNLYELSFLQPTKRNGHPQVEWYQPHSHGLYAAQSLLLPYKVRHDLESMDQIKHVRPSVFPQPFTVIIKLPNKPMRPRFDMTQELQELLAIRNARLPYQSSPFRVS